MSEIQPEATVWHSERKTSTQVEHYIVLNDGYESISFILKYNSKKKEVIAEPYTPPDIDYTIHDGCDHENDECFQDNPDSLEYQEVEMADRYSRAVNLLEANVKQRRIAESLSADKQKTI